MKFFGVQYNFLKTWISIFHGKFLKKVIFLKFGKMLIKDFNDFLQFTRSFQLLSLISDALSRVIFVEYFFYTKYLVAIVQRCTFD